MLKDRQSAQLLATMISQVKGVIAMASISYSKECLNTLKLLARSKNVLISGPPGTGKSRLLAEIAHAFENSYGLTPAGAPPTHTTSGTIPIPPTAGSLSKYIPAPNKTKRKVFRTVFHQNSKHRDFVSGITPAIKKVQGLLILLLLAELYIGLVSIVRKGIALAF